jgi:hypothetical protein
MNHLGAKTSHALSRQRLGSQVARLLSGSWRNACEGGLPPDAAGSDRSTLSETELTEITPLLCHLGAGALAWSQLRDTALANCPAVARVLREVYLRQRLSALLHEREIAQVITLLSEQGIEPVLIKGWAIARRYPEPALRPYGDVDLCVRPDQYDEATRVLRRIASIEGPFVDLHSGFTGVGQTKRVQNPKSKLQSLSPVRRLRKKDCDDWDKLHKRSHVVRLSEWKGPRSKIMVRVLSDEDHLRVLCRHLLRSGAHRPPWLCDVALLLEQVQGPGNEVQSPKSKVQGPVNQVQSPKSKVQSFDDRVAVKDSSRGLSAWRDTPGSDRMNASDPEGVKEDFGLGTLDLGLAPFDWDICLGRSARDANWIGVAVGLAHELLGARIAETPFANQKLPTWLVPAVLDQWGGKRSGRWAVGSGQTKVQSPKSKIESLYHRWDNPIRATAAVGGRFDERSRLPYRLLESAMRISGQ